MEQHFIEAISKLSTSHLLILLVGYSIGKLTTYLIKASNARYRMRILELQIEIKRLKEEKSDGQSETEAD
jgi:hypothetical protein